MILRQIPAIKTLLSWRTFAIVYTIAWFSILVLAWINWGSLSLGLKIAIGLALVLTTPAISDLRESR